MKKGTGVCPVLPTCYPPLMSRAEDDENGLTAWQVGSIYPDGRVCVHEGSGYYARVFSVLYEKQPFVPGTVATFLINTHDRVGSVIMHEKDLADELEALLQQAFPKCKVLRM